jgi:hypothetical protein
MPYKINFDKVDNYYNLVMNKIEENCQLYSYEYVSKIINRIKDIDLIKSKLNKIYNSYEEIQNILYNELKNLDIKLNNNIIELRITYDNYNYEIIGKIQEFH